MKSLCLVQVCNSGGKVHTNSNMCTYLAVRGVHRWQLSTNSIQNFCFADLCKRTCFARRHASGF